MAKTINIGEYITTIAYTKTEIDTALAGKAAADHSHDDRYYTETEIDGKIQAINGSISDLDTSVTASLATKASSDHNHDTTYAALAHTHTKSQITDFDHSHAATAVTYGNSSTVDAALTSLNTAVGNLQTANWDIEIVTELPNETSAKVGKLYFVHDANADDTVSNAFDEYIFTGGENGKFEKIGQRKIDLSNYVTDVDMSFSEGQLTISLTKGTNAFTF